MICNNVYVTMMVIERYIDGKSTSYQRIQSWWSVWTFGSNIFTDLKMKLNLMGFFLEKNIILFYVLGLININGTNKQCMLDTFLALPTLPYRPRIRLW